MQGNKASLIYVGLAFLLALITTPLVRALARRVGAVAKPKSDRWHKKPTAMMGGVAIFLPVCVLGATLAATNLPASSTTFPPLIVVLAASAFLFAVGLVDDFLHIKPYQKLVAQIMGASVVIYFGLVLPWTNILPLNMILTILWLVGITNALNLLDNMDGLAAGIAAIAAAFLGLHFLVVGQTTEATMMGVFAATLIGFLVYNSNPASIFMGDCGSLFIGFFLAATSLLSASTSGGRSRSFLPVLAVPVLTLVIPIFDTTLVTILRKASGRAASQGGRDHTSHRLVALGLSERRAVWLLYALAGLAGGIAFLVRDVELDFGLAAVALFTVALTLAGVYLANVKVYDEADALRAREQPLASFLVDLSYKRRIFEVLLDVVLITLAYYVAYVLFFGSLVEGEAWRLFVLTLPVILFVKLAAFLLAGVYRGIWRYTSVGDLVVFGKAVALGSVGGILALLFAFRFEGLSRTVFVIDAFVLLLLVSSSRMTFRVFRQMLPSGRGAEGRRVLIYGAGDSGELLLREARNNAHLLIAPVGFVDDDPMKKGKVMHGLRVFQGNGSLRGLCAEQRVEEIIIAARHISAERVREIARDCRVAKVTLKRMRIEFDYVESLNANQEIITERNDMTIEFNFKEEDDTIARRDFLKITILTAGVTAAFPLSLNAQNNKTMMNKYGLYGKLQATAGKGKELGEILLKAARLMENAKGCILYIVNREAGNPDSIYIIEVWDSKEDHDNSLGVPGVRELISQAIPILAGKPEGGMTLEVLGGKGLD